MSNPSNRVYSSDPDNLGAPVPMVGEFPGEPTGVKRQNGRLLTSEEVAVRTLTVLESILDELKEMNEAISNIR